jgi:hypothetical protein
LAGISSQVKLHAEGVVTHIFREAGIDVQFLECLPGDEDSPCREKPLDGDLWLQIMRQPPLRPLADATGFAVLVPSRHRGESYAAVSWPMVTSAARTLEADPADVLAASMAHEIGHLMLGSASHSRAGVMSSRIDRHQISLLGRGELLFTTEQSSRMLGQAKPAQSLRTER